MDKLAFTIAIDIPLSCVTLLAFLIHFNAWARSRPTETNVDLKSRLPTARIRVVALFVGMVSACWLINFPVWVVFALLVVFGFVVAVILGNDGNESGILIFFVAFIIREWSFGFPLMILHPAQDDSHSVSLSDMNRELLGTQGNVLSPLRPFGEAELKGRSTSVVSETGELLDIGTTIIVSGVENGRILVRSVQHSEKVK